MLVLMRGAIVHFPKAIAGNSKLAANLELVRRRSGGESSACSW